MLNNSEWFIKTDSVRVLLRFIAQKTASEIRMAKKFKVKKKFTLTDKCIRTVLRIVLKKPQFINLNEKAGYPKRCILIANHRSASGPFTYRPFMDDMYMVTAAHQVCEGFRSRWNYLYHTFYRQKCQRPKVISFLLATILGPIIPVLYKYAGSIPLYFDQRVVISFKHCIQALEEDVPVAFFPENSNSGYFELIKEFNMGYLTLAKLWLKRHNEDIPIYTHHYANNPSRIVTGKPMYYSELAKTHTDKEINEIFREYMNSLNSIGKMGREGKEDEKEEAVSGRDIPSVLQSVSTPA